MIRALLLTLITLAAVLPPRMCLCGHHHHAAPPAEQRDGSEPQPADPDHDGCPCQCRHLPRDITVPPRPAVEFGCGIELPPAAVEAVPVRSTVLAPVFRSESPPGRLHSTLPLYLSVARLLI